MNNVLNQAQDTIVNSTSVAFDSIWEDADSTDEEDLVRTNVQASNLEEDTEEEYEYTNEEINDNIDFEIQTIEDEVEKLERHNYLEETEPKDRIETINKNKLQLMQMITSENNEIVR